MYRKITEAPLLIPERLTPEHFVAIIDQNGEWQPMKVSDFIIATDRIRSGKNPIKHSKSKKSLTIINVQPTGYDEEVVVTYDDGSKQNFRGAIAEQMMEDFKVDNQ